MLRPFALAALALAAGAGLAWAAPAPADFVLTGARIYTVDPAHRMAEALAVSGGRLIYIGDSVGAAALVGPATKIEHGGGRLVLPGLVDAHLHPVGIADLPGCSLDSRAVDLDALPAVVRGCIDQFHIPAGGWVAVQQWNYTSGNRPSAANPTLRAALDHASADHPVALLGNDGHHGAFNSLALSRARNDAGAAIGYSRASIAVDFAPFAKLIGVDPAGEPNGTVNEEARDRLGAPDLLTVNLPALMQTPWKVPERLNSVGITAIQDAAVEPRMLPFYDALVAQGRLTVRVNLLQLFQPEDYRGTGGVIDYDRLLGEAKAVRARYQDSELVRAPGLKIFADGVLEGNPYATPPTLPDSPSLKPYLQPIFGPGAAGTRAVTGYVDTGSALCRAVRTDPARFDAAAFIRANGFHPGQCAISSGKFQHEPAVLAEYARRAHLAGFTLHIHAIGDAAVRLAVDAIEGARAADGNTSTPDAIAHLQVISPTDVVRIGRDHIFTVYTYSWATAVPDYDLSVVPFFEHVRGGGHAAFHDPASYYERAFYPARSTRDAGGVLAAGSDAPVNTRDPQPFVNMQVGVTRSEPGLPPANPWERLTIRDLIDAYTISGARAMGRETEFGSLEVGKSADFIILNQDILKLADDGHPEAIGRTKVLETWFRGKQVYIAK
jgi:predicted amidohydrolase YtcJ